MFRAEDHKKHEQELADLKAKLAQYERAREMLMDWFEGEEKAAMKIDPFLKYLLAQLRSIEPMESEVKDAPKKPLET